MKKTIMLFTLCIIPWLVGAQQVIKCPGIYNEEFIEHISVQPDSSLLVVTKNKGILKLQNFESLAFVYQEKEVLERITEGFYVKSMLIDRDYIWIGTLKDGLQVFDRSTRKLISSNHRLRKPVAKLNKTIYEVYKIYHQNTPKGHLKWFATDKGLFTIEQNKKLRQVTNLKGKHFTTLTCHKNVVWAASNDGKIWKRDVFDLSNGFEWKEVKVNTSALDFVTDMVFDNDGRLWLAGNNLLKYNPVLGTNTIYSEKQGLKSRRLSCITIGKKNQLWVGTEGGGLYKVIDKAFDNNSIRIHHVRKKRNKLKIKLKLSRPLSPQEREQTKFKLTYKDGTVLFLEIKHVPESRLKTLTNSTYLNKFFMPKKGRLRKGKYALLIYVGDNIVGQIKGLM